MPLRLHSHKGLAMCNFRMVVRVVSLFVCALDIRKLHFISLIHCFLLANATHPLYLLCSSFDHHCSCCLSLTHSLVKPGRKLLNMPLSESSCIIIYLKYHQVNNCFTIIMYSFISQHNRSMKLRAFFSAVILITCHFGKCFILNHAMLSFLLFHCCCLCYTKSLTLTSQILHCSDRNTQCS